MCVRDDVPLTVVDNAGAEACRSLDLDDGRRDRVDDTNELLLEVRDRLC